MESDEIFILPQKLHECESCYYSFYKDYDLSDMPYEPIKCKCDYCSVERTSKEILIRMIDILPTMNIYHMPKVLKKLISHIDLKDEVDEL